jgi:membrane protease YdiL (CAAX protease family)
MRNIAHVDGKLRVLQVFFIFVAPVLLLYFDIIPKGARIIVLLFLALMIYGITRKEQWSHHDFGLRTDNFKTTWFPYALMTLVGVFLIILFSKTIGLAPVGDWFLKPHFLYLFLVVSVLQEFAFRGFLVPVLRGAFPDTAGVVVINALLFTLIHIIYPIPQFSLPLAFIGGIAFALMYVKYPNLYLIAISHSILNFIAVLYGFFVIVHP